MCISRRILALILSCAMLFTLLPGATFAFAEEAEQPVQATFPAEEAEQPVQATVPAEEAEQPVQTTEPAEEAPGNFPDHMVKLNPVYEGILTIDDLEFPEPDSAELETQAQTGYLTVSEAGVQLRDKMENRTGSMTLKIRSTSFDPWYVLDSAFAVAVAHTGIPTEGDSLKWQYGGYEASVSRANSSTSAEYLFTYTLQVPYYTTQAQEKQLNTAVDNLLDQLNVYDATDYEKVCAVYDYICQNIEYDYVHLTNPDYTLQFTAYAALINKTAVCQGLSVLLYRLCLELGVDSRVITSIPEECHAWSIVGLDGWYYLCDSTWDLGMTPDYSWFLRGSNHFPNHTADFRDEYRDLDFIRRFPINPENYTADSQPGPGPEIPDDPNVRMQGWCGDNVRYVLTRDGTLTLSGTGATFDYSSNSRPPWRNMASELKKIVVKEGITVLGDYIFSDSEYVTQVELPSTLVAMKKNALKSAKRLTSVSLPQNLEEIGANAFDSCTAMTRVALPASLKTIGARAFAECDALTAVTLPNGLEVLGEEAFYDCAGIKTVTVSGTITQMGSRVFSYCDNLETVTISAGLERLGVFMFASCSKLRSVKLPSGLKIIGISAFSNCSALRAITLPAGLETIGSHALSSCGLTSINIPDSVTGIGEGAFSYNIDLTRATLSQGLTEIKEYVFGNCPLKNISIPAGVTSIGKLAFCGADITSLVIPEGVTRIEEDAFGGCDKLTRVTLPSTLEYFSGFGDCDALTSIVLPDGVQVIGSGALKNDRALLSVTIPESVTQIEHHAFSGCQKLETLELPSGLTEIPEHMMSYCSNLTRIQIPETVTAIGSNAFNACLKLNDVVLPQGLQSLGEYAFRSCQALTEITLPSSVSYVGSHAFAECSNLERATVSGDLGLRAFSGCSALKEVQLLNTVHKIHDYAFESCSQLTSMTFPASLEFLGFMAFSQCTGLEEIRFLGSAPEFGYAAFQGVTATAYYPQSNATWTGDKLANYEGNLTWVAEGQENPGQRCGDNAWWTYEDGTLTISGTGEMYSYYGDGIVTPWNDHREEITNLVIEEGITVIGEAAFAYMTGLKSVSLPASLDSIGNFAFMCCEALETLDLPENLTGIGQQAFWCCCSLKSVIIPASVTFLDACVFEECTALTDVLFLSDPDIPGFSTGNSLFRNCTSLEAIRVEEGHLGLESIDGVLYFIWRDSGEMCLSDYPAGKKDTQYRIADNTVIINQMSFGCNPYLEELIIPATVNSIGNYSFMDCSGLKTIRFEGSMPEAGSSMFWGVNATVSYPCGDSSWDNRESWNTEGYLGSDGSVTWAVSHEFADGSCIHCGEEEPVSHIAGDISGDGELNNKDLTRLFRYLSGYDVDVNEEALDVTGDGAVNNKDLTRLFRYLSGYDVEIH